VKSLLAPYPRYLALPYLASPYARPAVARANIAQSVFESRKQQEDGGGGGEDVVVDVCDSGDTHAPVESGEGEREAQVKRRGSCVVRPPASAAAPRPHPAERAPSQVFSEGELSPSGSPTNEEEEPRVYC